MRLAAMFLVLFGFWLLLSGHYTPFLLLSGTPALLGSVALSLGALFLLGVGVSVLTQQPAVRCGLRQLALGGIAALVTFVIGQAIGTAL